MGKKTRDTDRKVATNLPAHEKEALEKLAKANGRTLAAHIRFLLETYLQGVAEGHREIPAGPIGPVIVTTPDTLAKVLEQKARVEPCKRCRSIKQVPPCPDCGGKGYITTTRSE